MRILLIDTCGEVGWVALAESELVVGERSLPAREASATLLPTISELLRDQGWSLGDLAALGVVSGPGSFTGVRVGLAAAKGLCEATGLPLVAVSRLEVLAEAAGSPGCMAVLDAGRKEFYVREADGRERLIAENALLERTGERVVVTETRALEALAALQSEFCGISMQDVLSVVGRAWKQAGARIADGPLAIGEPLAKVGALQVGALVDANYVRSEADIYPKVRGGDGK